MFVDICGTAHCAMVETAADRPGGSGGTSHRGFWFIKDGEIVNKQLRMVK